MKTVKDIWIVFTIKSGVDKDLCAFSDEKKAVEYAGIAAKEVGYISIRKTKLEECN